MIQKLVSIYVKLEFALVLCLFMQTGEGGNCILLQSAIPPDQL